MKKIKICHLQLLPILSGVQNVMLSILDNLPKDRFEITVISKPGGDLVDTVINKGYNYIPVNSLERDISVKDITAFWELYNIFKTFKFDIVHTHSSKTGFLGRISAKLAGTPKVIHTVHGLAFGEFTNRLNTMIYSAAEKIASLFCEKIAFVNNNERILMINKHVVFSEQCTTIYNGVPLPEDHKTFEEESESINFVSVGRFWEQKNYLNLIKCFGEAVKARNNITLTLIGDGELNAEIESFIVQNDLQEKIILTGWLNNVINELPKFDCFILFSKWEGLPMSILEAMSVGLPIIASNIKGNNELVDKKNGYLIDVNSHNDLIDLLKELKYKDLKEKGEYSRSKIVNTFSLEKFISEYKELYLC